MNYFLIEKVFDLIRLLPNTLYLIKNFLFYNYFYYLHYYYFIIYIIDQFYKDNTKGYKNSQ